MILPIIFQLTFYFLNNLNGAHALSSDSGSNKDDATHSAINFTFKDSVDYLTTMHYLEARMTAFIKLADVEANSQVLLDRTMQLGKDLREEINSFQMGWSIPAVALTTKLEGEDAGRTIVLANGAFDKVRLEFEKQLAKIVAKTVEKLPFPASDPISTPGGYYTEVVYSYNLASSLLQLLNDIRKQANKDNSSTISTSDIIYESSCELGIGIPLPSSQEVQDMIEKSAKLWKLDYEKVFKFGTKLVHVVWAVPGSSRRSAPLGPRHGPHNVHLFAELLIGQAPDCVRSSRPSAAPAKSENEQTNA
ncbi:hypothetical protein Ddc_17279 [Ditylenchus destructor]|nr:hypothetical protein Ddc_17279 [Ditylenchus destructor]